MILIGFLHGFCTLDLRLQLIIQWSTGIFVLILCFLKRKQFATDISSKLGSSFTVVPFVIVVVSNSSLLFEQLELNFIALLLKKDNTLIFLIGSVHNIGHDCNSAAISALLLPHSFNQEGWYLFTLSCSLPVA